MIEHVEQPREFLAGCLAAVPSGGLVVVSTGNLDAHSSRLMGGRYWYCTLAEHISFTSPAWLSALADPLGFEVEAQAAFSHGRSGPLQRMTQGAENIAYRFAPALFSAARRAGFGGKDVRLYPELSSHPPNWASARDHYISLLRKR